MYKHLRDLLINEPFFYRGINGKKRGFFIKKSGILEGTIKCQNLETQEMVLFYSYAVVQI